MAECHGPAAEQPSGSTSGRTVVRVDRDHTRRAKDLLAVEEPLEIRLAYANGDRWQRKTLAITMRTPGHDSELAAGFLLGEGIVRNRRDILEIEAIGDQGNVVQVRLRPDLALHLPSLERHVYTSSSCGVCGKTSIAAVQTNAQPLYLKNRPIVPPALIHTLPGRIRDAQAVFDRTGGLHAAASFDAAGRLIDIKEDVGRHNALDKLIGTAFLAGDLPWQEQVILVSGRASFELVQKALAAGVPILAAVGAPSSLAVELAEEFDLTLLGFVRDERFNIYSGEWRIGGIAPAPAPDGGTARS